MRCASSTRSTARRLRTIALFTEPDRHAMFVREADEAVSLGPAQVHRPAARNQLKSSYVDYGRLERRLTARAGGGRLGGLGLRRRARRVRGPLPRAGHRVHRPRWRRDAAPGRQDRLEAAGRRSADPGGALERRPGGNPRRCLAPCRAPGLSAPDQSHGRRRRARHSPRAFRQPSCRSAFESARAEAFKAFGDPTVFMEQLVQGARHVEVQIIADRYGTTWAAGVRDCTIQRRHQKILEEAPSPALSPEQDRELREAAVRLSQAAGYQQRRHGGIPVRAANRALLLHGDEHPACRSNIR